MKALIVVFLLLAGCAGTKNLAIYERATELDQAAAEAARQRDAVAQATRAAEFAALAAKCQDSGCVEHIASMRTLSDAVNALGSASRRTDGERTPIPYRRDGAAQLRDVLTGLSPIAAVAGQVWTGIVQSNNSRDISISRDRENTVLVGHVVDGMSATATGVVDSIIPAITPSISVGGDYVSGTQTVGDTVTGDGNATRGSTIGDTVGRDQVGGDWTTNSGNLGDGNRQGSDGPIDQSDPGDDCSGESCNPITPPPLPGG